MIFGGKYFVIVCRLEDPNSWGQNIICINTLMGIRTLWKRICWLVKRLQSFQGTRTGYAGLMNVILGRRIEIQWTATCRNKWRNMSCSPSQDYLSSRDESSSTRDNGRYQGITARSRKLSGVQSHLIFKRKVINLMWFWTCIVDNMWNMSGLWAAVFRQQPANRTHNPQLHTIPTTWKPSTK